MAFREAGEAAPDFEVLTDEGRMVRLSDYKGRHVVLYFYPKADTPGCTIQACAFRDNYDAFVEKDIVVLGASPDTPEEQAAFKAKFNLPFILLADADHAIAEQYGVWGQHKFISRAGNEVEFVGIRRSTFLIDPEGKITHTMIGVDPATNTTEILEMFS